MSNTNENYINKIREDYIASANFMTINIQKGFSAKTEAIRAIIELYNVSIVGLIDLGLSPRELKALFTCNGNKYESKSFVIPGYTIFLNYVGEDCFQTAIAVNNCRINRKKIDITRGVAEKVIDRRAISVNIKTTKGMDVTCMVVYAPNDALEHATFMDRLLDRVCAHKDSKRKVIIMGDFNASRLGSDYCLEKAMEENEWPYALDNLVVDANALFNPGAILLTWYADGERVIGGVIDYVLVDCDLIDLCTHATSALELTTLTDHACVLLYTKLLFPLPPINNSTYHRLLDTDLMNNGVKPAIQAEVCSMLSKHWDTMHEITNVPPTEANAISFFSCVSAVVGELKNIAVKHCATEPVEKCDSGLPFGWTSEVRGMVKEANICRNIVQAAADTQVIYCKAHTTVIRTTTTNHQGRLDSWYKDRYHD